MVQKNNENNLNSLEIILQTLKKSDHDNLRLYEIFECFLLENSMQESLDFTSLLDDLKKEGLVFF